MIPCAENGATDAHYVLDDLPNKILAAAYQMVLPDAAARCRVIPRWHWSKPRTSLRRASKPLLSFRPAARAATSARADHIEPARGTGAALPSEGRVFWPDRVWPARRSLSIFLPIVKILSVQIEYGGWSRRPHPPTRQRFPVDSILARALQYWSVTNRRRRPMPAVRTSIPKVIGIPEPGERRSSDAAACGPDVLSMSALMGLMEAACVDAMCQRMRRDE
ncbi:hypothetical protein CFB52_030900 [Burkholderia sp. AU18528]|nr:hypothetical protein CFB35_30880 [Burkholderia sp. AU16482]PHP84922.1 hypothetical protein CFB52_030900 [Burkholderia sp. AU18528]